MYPGSRAALVLTPVPYHTLINMPGSFAYDEHEHNGIHSMVMMMTVVAVMMMMMMMMDDDDDDDDDHDHDNDFLSILL